MRILFPGDLEKEGEELFVKAWKQNPVFTGGNENRDGNGYGDENENGYENGCGNGCGNGNGYGEGEGTGRRMILVAVWLPLKASLLIVLIPLPEGTVISVAVPW